MYIISISIWESQILHSNFYTFYLMDFIWEVFELNFITKIITLSITLTDHSAQTYSVLTDSKKFLNNHDYFFLSEYLC